VAITALPTELPVMYVLTAVAGNAVAGRLQFSFRTGGVAVVATGVFMGTIDFEACRLIMIEQPVFP